MPTKPKTPKHSTLSISMPMSMRADVDRKMRAGGYGNVSEYFRHLIRQEKQRGVEERQRLREMLDEGDRSGPLIEADAKFWAELRALARSSGASQRRKAS